MQISKTLLIACGAAILMAAPSICTADDSTNAPAAPVSSTNSAATPMTKAEKKKAAKAAKAQAEAEAKAKKDGDKNKPAAKPMPKVEAKPTGALAPIAAPPSTLSADKQKELSDLLGKYKADQITPEEYHTQRAKILAGP